MKITNDKLNYTKPAFQAIKMIPCSSQEYQKILKTYGKHFSENLCILFKTRSINDCSTFALLEKTAAGLGRTTDWLSLNCHYNGINLPDTNNAPLFEITGREVLKASAYRMKGLFRNMCFVVKNAETVRNIPNHLKQIKLLNDYAEYDYPRFLKFLKKNNAEEISLSKYLEELAQRFGK